MMHLWQFSLQIRWHSCTLFKVNSLWTWKVSVQMVCLSNSNHPPNQNTYRVWKTNRWQSGKKPNMWLWNLENSLKRKIETKHGILGEQHRILVKDANSGTSLKSALTWLEWGMAWPCMRAIWLHRNTRTTTTIIATRTNLEIYHLETQAWGRASRITFLG